jgi:hypothetical protein
LFPDAPTDKEVEHAFASISSSTASGTDGVHAAFLKHGGQAVRDAFQVLLSAVWQLGTVPTEWRHARGVALYKGKGADRADPGSYRLISVTSVAARTAERVIKHRLEPLIAR